MKKIGLYIALSLTGLSPATTFTATTSTASTSASEPANAVSQQTALAQPASKELPPTMKQASYTRRFRPYLIELGVYLISMKLASPPVGDMIDNLKKGKGFDYDTKASLILLAGKAIRIALDVYPTSGGLGKHLFGMKLVDEKGKDADYKKVVLRAVIKNFPYPIFLLIGAWTGNKSMTKFGKFIRFVDIMASFITMLTGRFYWDRITKILVVMKNDK